MYTDAQAAAFIHAQPDFGIFARAGGVFQPNRLAAFMRKPRFTAGTAVAKQRHPQAGFAWARRRIQGHAIIPHGSNSFRPKWIRPILTMHAAGKGCMYIEKKQRIVVK